MTAGDDPLNERVDGWTGYAPGQAVSPFERLAGHQDHEHGVPVAAESELGHHLRVSPGTAAELTRPSTVADRGRVPDQTTVLD